MHILLIRHARHGVPALPGEGDLTVQGIEQARLTGEMLASWDVERLFCSPYVRAMQTGLVISRIAELPVEVMVALHNKVRPSERTLTRSEMAAKYPLSRLPGDMPEDWSPGQEDWRDVYRRAAAARQEFLSLEGTHERVAAITHAWPLDALASVLTRSPPKSRMRYWFDNCSTTLVSITGGSGRLHYLNGVSHLNGGRPLFFG